MQPVRQLPMAKIEFPTQLEHLLEGSELRAPLLMLADRAGQIFSGSKPPFFPDYTDHGIDHINEVLKSEVELVPAEVWAQSKSGHPHDCYVMQMQQ